MKFAYIRKIPGFIYNLIWYSFLLVPPVVQAQEKPCRYPENPLSVGISPAEICRGEACTLRLEGGGGGSDERIVWYTGSCGELLVGEGNHLVVYPAGTTTYMGRYENAAPCEFLSLCAFASVKVLSEAPVPDSATADPPVICQGQQASLTLFTPGNQYDIPVVWFSGSCKGLPIGTGNNLTVSPLLTTTYYGRYETEDPCRSVSICRSLTLEVMEKPSAPAVAKASPEVVCTGDQVVLSLEGGSAGNDAKIVWYIASCGGIKVGEGNNLAVKPEKNATYYGRYETPAPCNHHTECAYVMVEVVQNEFIPIAAIAASDTISIGETTVLTLTGPGDHEVVWSEASCGEPVIGKGRNITVKPSKTTTYYGRYTHYPPCRGASECSRITVVVR